MAHRCEHFFCVQRTDEAAKVGLASFHMTGAAQHWYYMLHAGTRRRHSHLAAFQGQGGARSPPSTVVKIHWGGSLL
jgi:hypothetical protein